MTNIKETCLILRNPSIWVKMKPIMEVMIKLLNIALPKRSNNNNSSICGTRKLIKNYPGMISINGTHNPYHNGSTLNGGTSIPIYETIHNRIITNIIRLDNLS